MRWCGTLPGVFTRDWRSILNEARSRICRVDRVLCGILLSLRVEKVEGLGTLGVTRDGRLLVDPVFVERITRRFADLAELTRVLIHEALHVLFLHPERCEKLRDRNICNLAADAIVEATIDETAVRDKSIAGILGFVAHGAVYAPRMGSEYHRGLRELREVLEECGIEWGDVLYETLESLYEKLEKCAERRAPRVHVVDAHPWGSQGAPSVGGGARSKTGGAGSESGAGLEGDKLEEVARLAARMAAEAARGGGPSGIAGKLPGVLPGEWERLVELLGAKVKLDWRQILQRYLEKYVPSDYTWLKPSRRSQALGVYLPGVLRRAWSIGVVLDTSGSIDDEEYSEFLEALYQLLLDRPVEEVVVAEADVELQRVERFSDPPPPGVVKWARRRRGYGGTFFHIPLRQLLEKHPYLDLVIYFTDGYGVYPDEPPRVPVIWVISRKGVKPGSPYWPPFGHVVRME